MLMNDFYTLHEIKEGENSFAATVIFRAEHPIFQGHFPQQPVVPGVCTMQMVKEIVAMQVGRKIALKQAPQVKFLQLITPEIQPTLHVEWHKEATIYRVSANLKLEKDLFKMTGNFEESN
jgi:3-hydroxyacyl-[acyl-carrier-protein] dehydratase